MKKRGFTLIEMLIVIVIIGILAGALIPRIGGARDKANDVAREADVRSISTALASYIMDNSTYPATLSTDNVFKAKYGMASELKDPVTDASYSYKTLDNNAHYVVCAELSNSGENKAGNFSSNVATDESKTKLSDLTEGSGAYFCSYN